MVVGIKVRVASTCFIDGDAGSPPVEVGMLLLSSPPEFWGAAEGIEKGSTMKEGRRAGADGNLWTLFPRNLQNHIKPTTKTTSVKKPTTPPMIGPIMTLPWALLELVEMDIADVNVPESPELDAGVLELYARVLELDTGVLELDVTDVAAVKEAPVVVVDRVGTALSVTPYKKKGKEMGWYGENVGTYDGEAELLTSTYSLG